MLPCRERRNQKGRTRRQGCSGGAVASFKRIFVVSVVYLLLGDAALGKCRSSCLTAAL